jgi:Na+-driven multidrug efflux pump
LFYGVWRATGQEKSFRGKETFKDAFCCRAFWEYVVFFLKAAYGTWLEYFGVELFTILIGVYGDQNIIASWVSVTTLMGLTWTLGMGFANSTRSFVTMKLAEREYKLAKKFARWGIIVNFLSMSVISL